MNISEYPLNIIRDYAICVSGNIARCPRCNWSMIEYREDEIYAAIDPITLEYKAAHVKYIYWACPWACYHHRDEDKTDRPHTIFKRVEAWVE